ncbi:MAG: ribonuclease HII [Promethearchaeota archaeon]
MQLIIGADEAGRGSVLGPLVICAACFEKSKEDEMKLNGVKDSKKLTKKKREELKKYLLSTCIDHEFAIIHPKKIDHSKKKGINLNQLEVNGFIKAINALLERNEIPSEIWIDAADVNEKRFAMAIKQSLKIKTNVFAMHKCDEKIISVGAASILAKTKRDEIIASLSEKYGNIGSGYPSDLKTRSFIKQFYLKNGEFPPIIRKSWDTIRQIKNEIGIPPEGQKSLFSI